jgi:hypothetical protein
MSAALAAQAQQYYSHMHNTHNLQSLPPGVKPAHRGCKYGSLKIVACRKHVTCNALKSLIVTRALKMKTAAAAGVMHYTATAGSARPQQPGIE